MRSVERFRELCRQAEAEKQTSRIDEIAKQMLELLEQELARLVQEHEEEDQTLQTR
jgi:hypothetical protein